MNSVHTRTGDNLPEKIRPYETATAFYGVVREPVAKYGASPKELSDLGVDVSLKIDEIIRKNIIVNWEHDTDTKNKIRNEIEDYLIDLKNSRGFKLDYNDIDAIMEDCIEIAKVRYKT